MGGIYYQTAALILFIDIVVGVATAAPSTYVSPPMLADTCQLAMQTTGTWANSDSTSRRHLLTDPAGTFKHKALR